MNSPLRNNFSGIFPFLIYLPNLDIPEIYNVGKGSNFFLNNNKNVYTRYPISMLD
jgi:acetyltransferase-like isoleucine patch superfamily enzyme